MGTIPGLAFSDDPMRNICCDQWICRRAMGLVPGLFIYYT